MILTTGWSDLCCSYCLQNTCCVGDPSVQCRGRGRACVSIEIMRAANQGLVMVIVTAEGRVRCNLRLCPPPHWHWCRALPCWRLCVSLVTVPPTATPHPVLGSIIHHLTASHIVLQHHHHNQLLQYWYLEKTTAIVTFLLKEICT